MSAIEYTMIKLQESSNLGQYASVSKKQFNQWKKRYIFKALQGEHYGRSFCKSFEIIDYILSSTSNINQCDRHIHTYYIR